MCSSDLISLLLVQKIPTARQWTAVCHMMAAEAAIMSRLFLLTESLESTKKKKANIKKTPDCAGVFFCTGVDEEISSFAPCTPGGK